MMRSLNLQSDLCKTLEMDYLLNYVSSFCVSDTGRELLQTQPFFTDAFFLEHELSRVSECVSLLEFDDPFPLDLFADLRPALEKADVEGAFLIPSTFASLLHFVRIAGRIKSYFDSRTEQYPGLQHVVVDLIDFSSLESEIDAVVDRNNEVKDTASGLLKNTRRSIYKLKAQVRQRLESVLRRLMDKGHAQEDQLTLRGGRLVIPVKDAHRGSLKGIVVDQSASGATVFMEPLDVLEMNNEIRRLIHAEQAEIERILVALTDSVRQFMHPLKEALDVLSTLDLLMAKARHSIEISGSPAEISARSEIVLNEARHPILMMKHGGKTGVIPLSLIMQDRLKTLLITGPNAGGKTVALKTVGLCALMHQFGLHIPAGSKSSLPVFEHIFADIGDQQSIEKDLSTFSSHIGKIKGIMDTADDHALVLFDEIGSATDPEEGSALAASILYELTRRGALTLATTHMGKLKMFAYETEGVDNASMSFNQESLKPTYRFQPGIPGASYAFEIAQRMGLSEELLEKARLKAGESKGRLESFILELEGSVQKAKTLQRENDIEKSRLQGLVHLYEDRIRQNREAEVEEKERAREESLQILKETNVLVENLVREIRETQAAEEAVKKARKALSDQRKKVQPRSQPKREPAAAAALTVQKNSWVRWKGHSGRGRVLTRPDSNGRVQVQFDNMKIKLPVKDLEVLEAPKEKKVPVQVLQHIPSSHVVDEVDLRGMMVDEALPALDKYLSDAALTGFGSVRIIHGKGTGALRQAVGQFLAGHHLAKSQRLGHWNEGDTGVTIVELS